MFGLFIQSLGLLGHFFNPITDSNEGTESINFLQEVPSQL
jgi:hypothetical protein